MLNLKVKSIKDKGKRVKVGASLKKRKATKYEMLGVKIPNIRSLVKNIKESEIKNFLKVNNTDSFEEILFKGFLLGKIKDEDQLKEQILNFLP